MNTDVVIIGAGPAGIFTAIEMLRRGSKQKIVIVEKGQSIENRRCPKDKTKQCVGCKPYCHITTGFSGAGAFSDGKLSLSYEVGGDLPSIIGEEFAQETIDYTDKIYLEYRSSEGYSQTRYPSRIKACRLPDPPFGHRKSPGYISSYREISFGKRRRDFVRPPVYQCNFRRRCVPRRNGFRRQEKF